MSAHTKVMLLEIPRQDKIQSIFPHLQPHQKLYQLTQFTFISIDHWDLFIHHHQGITLEKKMQTTGWNGTEKGRK